MAENIIKVEELSKSFGQHEVLRKIDFSVDKGEVICIVGSSGSGKSTLLRCINRLERQTSGRILYHGEEVRDVQKEINRYRSRVGIVFQSFNQFNGTVSPVGAYQKNNVSFFHYRIVFKVDESEMFSMQFSLLTVLSRFSR